MANLSPPPPASEVVERLLESHEPSLIWKIRRLVLGESAEDLRPLQDQIARSRRAQALVEGAESANIGVYHKWRGAHWALASLADIGYPPGDRRLASIAARVLDHWLDPVYFKEFEARTKKEAYAKRGVAVLEGRPRRCASQQGNALWSAHRLGFGDQRCEVLAERLFHWQWPDGGWNCDREPSASVSSFTETWLPLRGLAAHSGATGDTRALAAAGRSAEYLLERSLYKRRRDGAIIAEDFVSLHYPLYWHYDILGGLKAMAELDLLNDPRCADALDLLESKQLPDGGWPAQKKYYSGTAPDKPYADWVEWGGTGRRSNAWVTVDALAVLRQAGRLDLS